MNKWMILASAFENLGNALYSDCENMDATCADDNKFDELYIAYAILLENIRTTRQVIRMRFDEIDDTLQLG